MWQKYKIEVITALSIMFAAWLANKLIDVDKNQAVILFQLSEERKSLVRLADKSEDIGNRITALETTLKERNRDLTVGYRSTNHP